jgi:hypothetical protein
MPAPRSALQAVTLTLGVAVAAGRLCQRKAGRTTL